MKMQGVAREGLAGMTGAIGSIGSPGETEKLSSPFTIDALLARWEGCGLALVRSLSLALAQRLTRWEGGVLTRKDASHYLDTMCQDATCRMATALNGKYLLQVWGSEP